MVAWCRCPPSAPVPPTTAGRILAFADTPGHARHHHCVWDAATRGWFTGDTFGLSYREFDTASGPWMLPTTTPVQFEPEVLQASIRRLLAYADDTAGAAAVCAAPAGLLLWHSKQSICTAA